MKEDELSTKLDVLIRVTAAGVVKDQPLKEQVRILDSVGIKPIDIATILGKTPNHVNVILYGMRKKHTRKEKNNDGKHN